MDIHQLQVLEDFWRSTSKPTIVQREKLAVELGLEAREIQAWFQERRAQTQARKHMDEMKTLMALEAATEMAHESSGGYTPTQQDAHHMAMQSGASYASLQRSIAAAAASLNADMSPMQHSPATFDQQAVMYNHGLPHAPSQESYSSSYYGWSGPTEYEYQSGGHSLSKTSSTSSASSTRTGPGFNGGSNIDLLPMAAGAWTASPSYMTQGFEEQDFLPPMRSVDPPRARYPAKLEPPKAAIGGIKRPSLQRTNTCPATLQRPALGSNNSSMNINNNKTQPLRMRRRAKVPALGVGMCRSQSSLGDDGGADRRLSSLEFAPYPSTPLRRISSSYGFAASPGLLSPSVADLNLRVPYSANEAAFPFPASPISPEQGGVEITPVRRPIQGLSRHNSTVDKTATLSVAPSAFMGTPPMTPMPAAAAPAIDETHMLALGSSDPFLCHEPLPTFTAMDEHEFLAELTAAGL